MEIPFMRDQRERGRREMLHKCLEDIRFQNEPPGETSAQEETAKIQFLSLRTDRTSVLNALNGIGKDIYIPQGVVEVGANAFEGSGIETVKLLNSAKRICESAFFRCPKLRFIQLSESLETIDANAFAGCSSLSSITIPQSDTQISKYVFRGCSFLSSAKIPYSVTRICEGAFHSCKSLLSVTIHSNATLIGNYAFYGCFSLSSITIPSSVNLIGNYAF